MLGNLHVRFGERDGETSLRKGIWRFISTLLDMAFPFTRSVLRASKSSLGRQFSPPKIAQMSVPRRVGLAIPHEALEPQPGFFLR